MGLVRVLFFIGLLSFFLEVFLMCLITSAVSAKATYFSSFFLMNRFKRKDTD